MSKLLENKTIAILVADGFEQVELTSPRRALREEGADCRIVSPAGETVRGWNDGNWGDELAVDLPLAEADADRFDALVLPGGVINPDRLRRDRDALAFVRRFFARGMPVAAICHGPWTLIDAGVVRGRRLTSYPSIRTDLENAGAEWVDREVVVDGGLVTSRSPDDLPAFNQRMIDQFAIGHHAAYEPRPRRGKASAFRPPAGQRADGPDAGKVQRVVIYG